MQPVLSVSNLRVSFRTTDGWTPIVHGLSFDVAAGSTLAMVGGSGSGKSVTALATMRLLPPARSRVTGEVKLNGRSLLDLPESAMCALRGNEIGMIFQEPMTSLNPTLRIGFQISEVLRRHRGMSAAQAQAESIRLLERVQIPAAKARFHDFPHLMSGGMRQRVMIAMALACRPKVLIADEPTTALDVTVQAQILDLLRTLQQEDGLGILFITHDLGVVAEIADEIIVMQHGEAVDRGTAQAIFTQSRHPYTRALLAAAPRIGSMAGKSSPEGLGAVPESTAAEDIAVAGKPILEVRNLTKRFDVRKGMWGKVTGRVHAVENISFDIRAGETLSLVGESGSGKSTTGRCLIGLTRPSSGTIAMHGQDPSGLEGVTTIKFHNRMQMVFQDPYASLNPRMRISDSIAEPLVVQGRMGRREIDARVDGLLESVGLSSGMRDRFPHEFSGGQRQRICIARALSMRPDLLIADEAVSALDVSIKAQIIDLMLDLQRKMKLAFLFISHDMAVVERISHRVAVMYLGEIVEIGDRASVFGRPQHPYTKRLLAAVPVPDPERRNIRPRLDNKELKSPLRPVDYQHRALAYKSVGPDHLVQEWE
ncbi:MAG: ABC transporter ATP-binding protein [Mesorhizobium sp.]